jgi:predicted deacylase
MMNDPILRLRDDRLEWRSIEGEVVALDLGQSEYLGLNASGSVLWAALGKGATRAALAVELEEAFAVPREQAERDVAAFLELLAGRGLLADET